MTANEVNDIVMRLLAAADHIRGREREEILHHVGRLSRAAVRERTAAVDEMQKLRKKIVQQSAELKRIENATRIPAAPAAQAAKVPPPPKGRGFARFAESRLQALAVRSTPALDYGPDYGRLSRPGNISQPDHKAPAAAFGSVQSRAEQQSASKGASASSAGHSGDAVIQEQHGLGHFNQARFLALQAGPLVTASSGDAGERSSPLEGPAQPAHQVTAANAEPVARRGQNRSEMLEESDLTMQDVDQLLDEIQASLPVPARLKRRASDGDLTAAAAAKKQLVTAASYTNTDAMHPVIAGHQAFPDMPFTTPIFQAQAQTQPTHNQLIALQFGRPTCTHCFQHQVPDCDGRAHCNQGSSHRCYYVLCDPVTCLGAACVMIHPSQYDLSTRKSGQVRRLVIGDPISLPPGHRDERAQAKTVAAMGRAIAVNQQLFAGLPAPNQGFYQMPQAHVKALGSASRPATKGLKRGHKTGYNTAANPALRSELARPVPLSDARGIKVESSEN